MQSQLSPELLALQEKLDKLKKLETESEGLRFWAGMAPYLKTTMTPRAYEALVADYTEWRTTQSSVQQKPAAPPPAQPVVQQKQTPPPAQPVVQQKQTPPPNPEDRA